MADTKEPKKTKFERTTVGEAKLQLDTAGPTTQNYVWGTRLSSGNKDDFKSYLSTQKDSDELVWGT